jgi:large subunit ribosomal protein L4
MKLQVINIDGKKTENIELSDKIFSVKPNKNLIQSIVEWQLNHFKPRTAKTKQRGEVKGSTAKIYAQKGTGGARHSSRTLHFSSLFCFGSSWFKMILLPIN